MKSANEPRDDPFQPVREIFTRSCTALWSTSYNLDLPLFGEFLLPRLGDPPLNVAVLADQHKLSADLDRITPERVPALATVNSRWLVRTVPAAGVFHPKTYLAATPGRVRLFVGSGNLTESGLSGGREVFTSFVSGTPDGDAAINTWRHWMRELVATVNDPTLADRFQLLEKQISKHAPTGQLEHSPLLHNLQEPLIDQLTATVQSQAKGPIRELHLTAPYYDQSASAVAELIKRLHPKQVTVYLTSTTSVDGPALVEQLKASDASIELRRIEPDQFVHAKLIGVATRAQAWLFSGSANLSRAALLHTVHKGNYELMVHCPTDPSDLAAAFLPPNTSASPMSLEELAPLTFDFTPEPTQPKLHLMWARHEADGKISVNADSPIDPNWQLHDTISSHSIRLGTDEHSATTTTIAKGRLARLIDTSQLPTSNRVVVDDPDQLDRTLHHSAASSTTDRPDELLASDLSSPTGAALAWLHRHLVLDSTEVTAQHSGDTDAEAEATEQVNDDVWDRLDREKLTRDRRAIGYAHARQYELAEDPLLGLIEAFSGRAPAPPSEKSSLLRVLIEHHKQSLEAKEGDTDEVSDQAPRRWRPATRIRVRARNALRRWAAAQSDPRLTWVDFLAPLENLRSIATEFAFLHLSIAVHPKEVELSTEDLNDLWLRWLSSISGTGASDGYLDRISESDREHADALLASLREIATALSWLTIRPGPRHRDQLIAAQPILEAAYLHDLLGASKASADFLSMIDGQSHTPSGLDAQLEAAITYVDDELWCTRIATEMGLSALQLTRTSTPGMPTRLTVTGIDGDPLTDPRLPRLLAATRRYRREDGVAVWAQDGTWRIMHRNSVLHYLADKDEEVRTSPHRLTSDALAALEAKDQVLAPLFDSNVAAA